jgi:hypothetical protein
VLFAPIPGEIAADMLDWPFRKKWADWLKLPRGRRQDYGRSYFIVRGTEILRQKGALTEEDALGLVYEGLQIFFDYRIKSDDEDIPLDSLQRMYYRAKKQMPPDPY